MSGTFLCGTSCFQNLGSFSNFGTVGGERAGVDPRIFKRGGGLPILRGCRINGISPQNAAICELKPNLKLLHQKY